LVVHVQNYTTLCKRAEHLSLPLPTIIQGPIHAVLDSTGLEAFSEGELTLFIQQSRRNHQTLPYVYSSCNLHISWRVPCAKSLSFHRYVVNLFAPCSFILFCSERTLGSHTLTTYHLPLCH